MEFSAQVWHKKSQIWKWMPTFQGYLEGDGKALTIRLSKQSLTKIPLAEIKKVVVWSGHTTIESRRQRIHLYFYNPAYTSGGNAADQLMSALMWSDLKRDKSQDLVDFLKKNNVRVADRIPLTSKTARKIYFSIIAIFMIALTIFFYWAGR
jgi:hypothetical protein